MIADFGLVVGIRVRISVLDRSHYFWWLSMAVGIRFVCDTGSIKHESVRCCDGFWIMVVLSMVDGCL